MFPSLSYSLGEFASCYYNYLMPSSMQFAWWLCKKQKTKNIQQKQKINVSDYSLKMIELCIIFSSFFLGFYISYSM